MDNKTIQQELNAATSKAARIERIRKYDEVACIAAIDRVSVRLQETILLEHDGTLEEKQRQCLEVLRMGLSLRAAMLGGGRAWFEEVALTWVKAQMFEDFMRLLDHWLTKMPTMRPYPVQPSAT